MRGGGGGGGGGRRRVPNPKGGNAPPLFNAGGGGGGRRESDASLCSSRPSSVTMGHAAPGPPISDRSYQSAALRSVNTYLHSLSFPSLRPPLPSARDITETLHFVLSRLEWPLTSGGCASLEDDLPSLLKQLGCPIKLNKSALKAPGTPHAWPHLLATLHWLVQLARYHDHLSSSASSSGIADFARGNDLLQYTCRSYSLFIIGDDDAVEALDREHVRKAEDQAASAAAAVERLEKEAVDLELKLGAIRSGLSPREALEREAELLKGDIKKFEAIIENFTGKVVAWEKGLAEREKELEAKVRESRRISEENEELRKKIGSQAVNVRDVERMKKELQAVERDIMEAENGRNDLEEKSWELDVTVERELKGLEALVEQSNQAIRKLKLGNDFQFVLNAKGSSPTEVLGTNYKTMLKPALNALADETKKSSVTKLEDKISLQQQCRENAIMLEEKRERLVALQVKIDEAEARSNLLKREMDDLASRCEAEAERMKKGVERKVHQLDMMEEEAEKFLKDSELKLQDAVRETDEEIQMCASELMGLIDAVSEYKEYMESTISVMKADLSETAQAVAEACKTFLSAKLASAVQSVRHSGSKRARLPSTN